ncbi:SDR family NAD(P)-dependent oxidoreductase [Conyzicola nivalis]|uniref:Short-chain dehydrogenase n=1 Tax=Conyzicola nivalis TaxID=1477021 RepID=A0A916WHI9_9MICO|nr:SDR family oxidoreductase [Conyzicola nivalis]GGB00477.1 short-chain dehydrogenase [Conyzicola nivalis]
MTTTLITGANKGLGFETARRLIELGHTVYLGARDAEKGAAAAESLGARFVQIDVTDDASVAGAAASILEEAGHLDVLVNNAGVSGSQADSADVTADIVREVYDVNVFGIVRVTHAMLPLLRKSQSPVVVNVSSGLGSFDRVNDPAHIESTFATIAYGSSKSAATMLAVQYAKAFPEMRVNAVDPGYTATDLNGNSGPQTVTEGTDAVVAMATIGTDGPTGTFVARDGVMPW